VQLLTHTSGLPANWPVGWSTIAPKESPAAQRAVMMKELGKVKLKSKPGEKFHYSNLGYTVAGAILDRLGKAPWEEQLQKKIFQPLGIQHAGFGPPGKPGALLQPWPHHKNGKPVAPDGVLDNPPVMNPAGRVHMSVADYQRFLAEVLRLARGGKGLLKPATAKRLFAPPLAPSKHGLSGWVDFQGAGQKGPGFRHDGSNTMNYCTALVLPEHNLAVCVFTNQGGDAATAACVEVRKQLVEREK
jgi:CubicO group peptidase (beta-lactamase class C family)